MLPFGLKIVTSQRVGHAAPWIGHINLDYTEQSLCVYQLDGDATKSTVKMKKEIGSWISIEAPKMHTSLC